MDKQDFPFPRWILIPVVLLAGLSIDSETYPALLTPWQALSFCFSVLPLITYVAYYLECRQTNSKMTFRGYWELLGVVRKAKKESYQKTAGMLLPGDAPRIVGVVLAWLLVVAVWVAGNWSRIRDCIGLI